MSVIGQIISTTFASAASPPTYDPYYANVSLLLHADGTNGSTSFPDNSPNPKTVTANGNAAVSTTQWKFGGASAYFSTVSDSLTVPKSSEFLPLANQDFTFEAWVYVTSTPGGASAQIMGIHQYGTSADWILDINSSMQLGLYLNSISTRFANTTNIISLNTWTHVAASRSGTGSDNLKIFVNGVGQSFSTNASLSENGPSNLSIGTDTNGQSRYYGYIDDLRITKGVGRYTANFTPPTAPFPNSGPPVTSQTFSYTGAIQNFTVPTGVTLINVSMWGGGGASNNVSDGAAAKGGAGGFVKFTIAVTPGESLTVNVGGKGSMPVIQYRQPGGAGGMSALLRSATYLGISGGGGGGGGYGNSNNDSWGGSGGGTTANSGGNASIYATGGGGGTQSAGGTGGTPGPGQNGASLQGGNGSGSNLTTLGGWPNGGNASTNQEHGGGGGGGYYGGGGGGGDGTWGAGGGGGSSYTDPAATSVTHIKSAANDNSAPGTAETGYVTGVALGGFQTTNPGNGLVYISW